MSLKFRLTLTAIAAVAAMGYFAQQRLGTSDATAREEAATGAPKALPTDSPPTEDQRPDVASAASDFQSPRDLSNEIFEPGTEQTATPTLMALLESSRDLAEGLRLARETFGVDDPGYASAYTQLAGACETASEKQRLADAAPVPANAGTDWAVKALIERCNSFLTDRGVPPTSPDSNLTQELVAAWVDGDPDLVAQKAIDNLATATDTMTLMTAIEVLISSQKLPQQEIFGSQLRLSEQSLQEVAWNASTLRECDSSRQCGPNSFPVLAFCVHNGCAEGRSLIESIREASSAREYQAVIQLYRWLALQQRRANRVG